MAALDRDTCTVVARLRAAHAASGLSQAAFATALATSGSRLSTYLTGTTRPSAHFCVRAERIGAALGVAASRRLVTPPVASSLVRSHLEQNQPEWAWRSLLQCRDHLVVAMTSPGLAAVDAWEAVPGTCGDLAWDVLLAAIIGHEHQQHDVAEPARTDVSPLPRRWTAPHPFLAADRVRAETPDWLSRLNLHVAHRDLVTA